MMKAASKRLIKLKISVQILEGLTSTILLRKFLRCKLTARRQTSFCLPMEQFPIQIKLFNWLLRMPLLIEDYTLLELVMEQMRHSSRNALLKALEISISFTTCQKLNTKSSTLCQTLNLTTRFYKISISSIRMANASSLTA